MIIQTGTRFWPTRECLFNACHVIHIRNFRCVIKLPSGSLRETMRFIFFDKSFPRSEKNTMYVDVSDMTFFS